MSDLKSILLGGDPMTGPVPEGFYEGIHVFSNHDPGDEQPEPRFGIPSLRGMMSAYLYAKALKEGLANFGAKADFKLEYRNGEYVLVGEIALPVPTTRITYTEPAPRNY